MPPSFFKVLVDGDASVAVGIIQTWYTTLAELPKPQLDTTGATSILIGDQERLDVGTEEPHFYCKKCGSAPSLSQWGSHPCFEGVATAVTFCHSDGTTAHAIESLALMKALHPQDREEKASVAAIWLVLSRHILLLFEEYGIFIAPVYFQYMLVNHLLYPELSGSLDMGAVRELLSQQWLPVEGRSRRDQSMHIPACPMPPTARNIWLGSRTETLHTSLTIWSGLLQARLDSQEVVAPFHRVTSLIVLEQTRQIVQRREFRCLNCHTWQLQESAAMHTCGQWAGVVFLHPDMQRELAPVEAVLRTMRRGRNTSTFKEMWTVVTRHVLSLATERLIAQESLRRLVHLQLLDGFCVDHGSVDLLWGGLESVN